MRRLVLSVLALVLLSGICAGIAVAQVPSGAAAINGIVSTYQAATTGWQGTLLSDALPLFWALAGIEFAFAGIKLVLKQADFGEFVAEVVQQILFIGLFYAILTNFAAWGPDITNSLRQAGQTASGSSIVLPGDVFQSGQNLASAVVSHMSWWPANYGADVGLAVSGLVVLIVFALIAAFMVLILVESYIAIAAGILFLGFGGSRWTNQYALRTISYVVSVGAKLFMMQLVVGLGQTIVMNYARQAEVASTNTAVFTVVGASVVLLALVKILPDMVQGMINGASFQTGSALGGAVAGAVAGAATGGAVGLGATSAVKEAGLLASQQAGERMGPAPASAGGRIGYGMRYGMRVVSAAGAHLGGAALADVRNRLEGDPTTRSGYTFGRMARMMRSQRTEPPPSPP